MIKKVENLLVIEVEDNGIGREASAVLKKDKKHKSWASTIMTERMDALNKVNENNNSFDRVFRFFNIHLNRNSFFLEYLSKRII